MKKHRKVEKKIPDYESASDGENPDFSESDDGYTDAEKKLLEKTRPRQEENFDSEDEVLGFSDNDEEDRDSLRSDIEGLEEEDFDLPDDKAWGKKKKAFYSTDYVDPDFRNTTEKAKIMAQMEEQEALNIQKRLAEELDEADFGFDIMPKTKLESSEQEHEEKDVVKTDLSKLSSRQKHELLEKDSPELCPIVSDIQDRYEEVVNVLQPFLKAISEDSVNPSVVAFIRTKYKLLLNYFTYGNFYLMLKAKRLPVQSHPVIKQLAQCRQLLVKLESVQGNLLDEIKEVLADKSKLANLAKVGKSSIKNKEQHTGKVKSKKVTVKNQFEVSEAFDDDEDNDVEMGDAENAENPLDEEEIGKRGITYEIIKNRGLTPYRRKELRNPRVKHRMKYRKATIRRKGAVRKVRTETSRYGGEISGIKANVVKSIKIK